MAEYYPLLFRAVASLRDAPVEKRRAIYDRARHALLGQLRSMQPPVPEEAIARESTALDEAIERIEADMARDREPASASPSGSSPDANVPPAPPPPPSAPPVTVDVQPGADAAPVPTVVPAIPPADPVAAAAAAPSLPRARSQPVRPSAAAPPAPPSRPAAEALQRLIADQGQNPPVIRAERSDDEDARQRASSLARAASALPSAPRLTVPSFADAVAAAGTSVESDKALDDAPGSATQDKPAGFDDGVRPAAPRPITRERFNPRALILVVIGALVVAGIAYAAYRLRDKPEALARARAARAAAEQAETQRTGKVSNRAVAGAVPPSGVASSENVAGPAIAPPASAPSPSVPAEAAPGATRSGDAESAAAGARAAPPAIDQAAIPVAQRAAFLIDAPDDPQKVKTFVGTVVWRVESVNPGQGQPLVQAVHADIDIPDVGLKLTMVLQKNLEAQFPASHTLDLRFTPAANSLVNGVKQINVPQMRKDDSPTGDPLEGLPVTITENYFLVGLSRGDAAARNMDLLRSRNWFDIPLMMTSGKIAKITFEKGATGEQVVNQVIESWQ